MAGVTFPGCHSHAAHLVIAASVFRRYYFSQRGRHILKLSLNRLLLRAVGSAVAWFPTVETNDVLVFIVPGWKSLVGRPS